MREVTVLAQSKYYLITRLEGMRQAHKNLSKSLYPTRNLNPAPIEYKSGNVTSASTTALSGSQL
jgi:hypothetical protein